MRILRRGRRRTRRKEKRKRGGRWKRGDEERDDRIEEKEVVEGAVNTSQQIY